jgi:hypothetical protein
MTRFSGLRRHLCSHRHSARRHGAANTRIDPAKISSTLTVKSARIDIDRSIVRDVEPEEADEPQVSFLSQRKYSITNNTMTPAIAMVHNHVRLGSGPPSSGDF